MQGRRAEGKKKGRRETDDCECLYFNWKGSKVEICAKYSGIVTSNAFQVLEDKVRAESTLIFVGNSLVRHQDKEFCKKKNTLGG